MVTTYMSSIFFITYYRVSYDHCRGTPPWSAICRWQPLHPVRIVQTQINRKICDTQQFDFIFTPSFNKGTAIRQPVPNQVNNFCSRGCKKSEKNLYEKIQHANYVQNSFLFVKDIFNMILIICNSDKFLE